MKQVRWTIGALADLRAIRGYIAQFNPGAAHRLSEQLLAVGSSLGTFPHRGRAVAHNLREITTVYPYIIRYEIDRDDVLILRVRHGVRRP